MDQPAVMKLSKMILVSLICDACWWVGLMFAGTLIASHYDHKKELK